MDEDSGKVNKKEIVFLRVFVVILLMVVLAVCAVMIVLITAKDGNECPGKGNSKNSKTDSISTTDSKYTLQTTRPPKPSGECSEGIRVTPPAHRNPSIFQELTKNEILNVRNFLMSRPEFDLVLEADATEVRSNYIAYIDLKLPNKSDALAFLDSSAKRPSRLARVSLVFGKKTPPVIEEYVVGTLPEVSWYAHDKNPSYQRYPIPFNRRQVTTLEKQRVANFYKIQAEDMLKPLLMASYGTSFFNCGNRCLDLTYNYFETTLENNRSCWFYAMHNTPSFYLHYLGLYIHLDMSSLDKRDWHWTKAYYNDKFYDSMKHLRTEFENNKLNLINFPFPSEDPMFSDMKKHGNDNIYSVPKAGPRLVEPEGRRFRVTGRHVEYRGWSFDFGVDVIHGPRLYDIKFRNERIVYELAVQEACVFYAGNNPATWSSFYYDTSVKLGYGLSRLARGVDCPETAVYVDYTLHATDMKKIKRAACIFEHNGGIPIRRHYADNYKGAYTFYGGMTDHYLVVRSIGGLYNYDYIFDMIFRINGVIQVRLTATGYPQIAFASEIEKPYGGLIHKFAVGSFHQHLYNVKVDFDILDQENRFATYDFGTETFTVPETGRRVHQLKYDVHEKTTEKEAALKYEFRKPKYYVIYNNKTQNANGMKRAYRIHNEAKTPLLLDENSKVYSASWARYQLATTVHHDYERFSSHHFASTNGQDPIVNFQKYIDNNERIVDQDLVMWITMGVHHLPSAEDLPVTPTTGNQFSVYLKPFNFFDECPSMQSRDSIYVEVTDGKPNQNLHGINRNLTCIPEYVPYGMDPEL